MGRQRLEILEAILSEYFGDLIDKIAKVDVAANTATLVLVNEYELEELFTFRFNASIQAQKRCSHELAGFVRHFI